VRRKKKNWLVRAQDGTYIMVLLLIANALGVALVTIGTIGPPPRWHIKGLWVNQHADSIRIAAIALGIALSLSAIIILWRRPRGMVLSMWVMAIAVAVAYFWAQIEVIVSVVYRHVL
jgi:hypothetical protein